jgi:DNA-binding response OmpR family regulator
VSEGSLDPILPPEVKIRRTRAGAKAANNGFACENPVNAGDSAAVGSEPLRTIGAIRLAIIDNDSGFVTVLTKRTEAAGWQHRLLASAAPPEDLVAMKLNALVIDLAVLGDDRWDYLERICGMLPDLGVIVCTGQSTVAQRVRGLRLGVDDWMSKPCHPEEVMARVEAVARRRRRSQIRNESGPLVAGELEIRADQYQGFVSGVSVDLTRREFELLQLLADAKGQVLERETIYQRVWGYAMAHGDRSVDVFIRKLRQKLQKRSPSWSYIHTHFGVGYRFDPEPEGGMTTEAAAASDASSAPDLPEELETATERPSAS